MNRLFCVTLILAFVLTSPLTVLSVLGQEEVQEFKVEGSTEELKTPTEIAITNDERLSLENFQLKIQLLQTQIENQRMGLDAYLTLLVNKYKIDRQGWNYDQTNGKFIKVK